MLKTPEFKRRLGFLGNAKSSNRSAFNEYSRISESYSYGKNSYFTTPTSSEERKKFSSGMKR